MSAYLVSSHHINALVSWAHANGVAGRYGGHRFAFDSPVTCEVIGEILYTANVLSISVRYGPDAAESDSAAAPYTFELLTGAALPTPGSVANGCACLDYQSCETQSWPESMACAIVAAIKQAAEKLPVTPTDGAWDIDPESET